MRARRPGLLANPRSSRFAPRAAAIRAAAQHLPGTLYREASEPCAIAAAAAELMEEGADIIIVAGGDGTLQAVLNGFRGEGPALPPLAIVPCGSTNMTALDLGCAGSPLRALERLHRIFEADNDVPVVTRPLLRIARSTGPVLQGMFFGAGAVTAGVRYFRDRVRGRGLTGELASGLAVLRMLVGLIGGSTASAAVPAALIEDGAPTAGGSYLLLLATTLERLLLGSRPYWGREAAPMHFTAIREHPERFWRSLPRIAAGHGARENHGYHSRNLRSLDLELAGDFVLDGEIHAVGPGDALRIEAAGPVRFAVA